jgi:hypothetical protein
MTTRLTKSFRPSFDALEARDAMSSLNTMQPIAPPPSMPAADLAHEGTHAAENASGASTYVPHGIIAILIG